MAGKKKLMVALHPSEESAENAVNEILREIEREAFKKHVNVTWHEEDADPV